MVFFLTNGFFFQCACVVETKRVSSRYSFWQPHVKFQFYFGIREKNKAQQKRKNANAEHSNGNKNKHANYNKHTTAKQLTMSQTLFQSIAMQHSSSNDVVNQSDVNPRVVVKSPLNCLRYLKGEILLTHDTEDIGECLLRNLLANVAQWLIAKEGKDMMKPLLGAIARIALEHANEGVRNHLSVIFAKQLKSGAIPTDSLFDEEDNPLIRLLFENLKTTMGKIRKSHTAKHLGGHFLVKSGFLNRVTATKSRKYNQKLSAALDAMVKAFDPETFGPVCMYSELELIALFSTFGNEAAEAHDGDEKSGEARDGDEEADEAHEADEEGDDDDDDDEEADEEGDDDDDDEEGDDDEADDDEADDDEADDDEAVDDNDQQDEEVLNWGGQQSRKKPLPRKALAQREAQREAQDRQKHMTRNPHNDVHNAVHSSSSVSRSSSSGSSSGSSGSSSGSSSAGSPHTKKRRVDAAFREIDALEDEILHIIRRMRKNVEAIMK